MAGGRNHAPLEQLLDEIKFQRRQVDQPHFCLTFDMFQKQERAEKLLPRPRVHHRPQHNILDRPLCSAFPLPGGRLELSNQGLFILLLSLTFTNHKVKILWRNSPVVKAGLHKLWYPGIQDTSTWSKFGAHGEHGDVFLFSNLGAL